MNKKFKDATLAELEKELKNRQKELKKVSDDKSKAELTEAARNFKKEVKNYSFYEIIIPIRMVVFANSVEDAKKTAGESYYDGDYQDFGGTDSPSKAIKNAKHVKKIDFNQATTTAPILCSNKFCSEWDEIMDADYRNNDWSHSDLWDLYDLDTPQDLKKQIEKACALADGNKNA